MPAGPRSAWRRHARGDWPGLTGGGFGIWRRARRTDGIEHTRRRAGSLESSPRGSLSRSSRWCAGSRAVGSCSAYARRRSQRAPRRRRSTPRNSREKRLLSAKRNQDSALPASPRPPRRFARLEPAREFEPLVPAGARGSRRCAWRHSARRLAVPGCVDRLRE